MRVSERTLELRTPWTVSHGTSTHRTNVFVDLGDGLGEAPIVPYYPYDVAIVQSWLRDALAYVARKPDTLPGDVMAALPEGPPPARSALDMALHDRLARQAGVPLYRLLELDPVVLPLSTITVAIPSNEEEFNSALERVASWPLLKIKLGSGSLEQDVRLATLARDHFPGQICVDANGGWTVDEAARMLALLGEMNVSFVEEPLRDQQLEPWAELRQRRRPGWPPVLADESMQSSQDIERLGPYIDGINVKLAKMGGLTSALAAMRDAKARGLKVLLGCMVESSLGVTAAAHLAPLADFADLDGHLQLSNDPYAGVRVEKGIIELPKVPGLGVTPGSQGGRS